jgi:GTP diphosphokinase / guanosine-3',5'-bis(diphosphate) 3'-diphosphatase
LLRKIEGKLTQALGDSKIAARVVAREKHLYSIYLKMYRKQSHLADIVDVYGVRVIVDDVDSCYRALGITHQLFKPMPGRFKDYISIPRVNGYQSLHTTLFGPNGLPLEVQIRTEQMDKVAERGIAAHWQYKAVDKDTYSTEDRAREWLAGLMEMERSANSEEFLETVKADLFPDKVYVFTPKGAIMRLPRGATAVDFAYAVHTDVGNRCVAAKIDRRAVPLKTLLQNGETVEIVTQRGAHPNPSWVNFVTTAKARNAIRGYLKNLKRDEAQELGRRLINQELLSYSLNLKKLPKTRLDQLLKELGVADEEALLEQVGLGERLAPVVAGLLAQQRDDRDSSLTPRKPLEIAGTEGAVVSYAHCCYPIPGDEIVGFMSSGRGIVIHRDRCRNLAEYRKQPAKWIPVNWTRGVKAEFESEIQVRTLDRVGLLAEVAGRISAAHTNIEHVRVDRDGDASALAFRLKVRDRRQLAQFVRSIRTIPGVVRVSRSAS